MLLNGVTAPVGLLLGRFGRSGVFEDPVPCSATGGLTPGFAASWFVIFESFSVCADANEPILRFQFWNGLAAGVGDAARSLMAG